tara:strand:- start:644 stop:1387 length:744 start_codon:yes stop_codon:yes gene_type:complete
MTFSAKYLGSSGWLISLGNFKILIDPWLKGNLIFPPGPWLIEGKLTEEIKISENIDILLLTQGLADHTHIPTLEILSRNMKVVGSKSAIKIANKLGFKDVYSLDPGDKTSFSELIIEATAGAPVPNIENGYIIDHPLGSIYIEPHGYLDKKMSPRKIDAVITPIVDLSLPIAGNFITGKKSLPDLLKIFSPKTVLSSTTGGTAKFSGLLNSLISVDGNEMDTKNFLEGKTEFISSVQGSTYKLNTHK